jgi:hypothetical protein
VAVSRAERLRKKREAERQRRERIRSDPDRRLEEHRKRRARIERTKEAKKSKKMSKKQRQEQQKKWREAKRKYVAKKKQLQNESKSLSSAAMIQPIAQSTRAESNRKKAKRRAESKRVKQYYLRKKLENRITSLEKIAKKYKVRCFRMKQKMLDSNSPRSTVHRELKKNKENVSPRVRKQLIFGRAVLTDIGNSLTGVRSKKQQKKLSERIKLPHVKKYKFLELSKRYFPFQSFRVYSKKRRAFGAQRRQTMLIKKLAAEYFEDDAVSTLSPSKNDQIVRKKVRKQKRFISNSLTYLYQEFCKNNSGFRLSYATFCRTRPFWTVNRAFQSRDTCLCKKCDNSKMICRQLHRLKVINDGNLDRLIEREMFCEPSTELCRFRKCKFCDRKVIQILEFDGLEETVYENWLTETEVGSDGQKRSHTIKKKIVSRLLDLVLEFRDCVLPIYIRHRAVDMHQKNAMKLLKHGLTDNDLVIHVDFAENYSCKYAKEVQVIHFGGNRQHISLHTGVLYRALITQSFCTISPDLQHDAIAIFKHLQPILEDYRTEIESLHFQSDSPATQYRNLKMFWIIIAKIVPLFDRLNFLSWSFSESGHGKGPVDGVGATLKRTCDARVSHGMDVSNFNEFEECVSKIEGVRIITVQSVTDKNLQEEAKKFAKSVPGKLYNS